MRGERYLVVTSSTCNFAYMRAKCTLCLFPFPQIPSERNFKLPEKGKLEKKLKNKKKESGGFRRDFVQLRAIFARAPINYLSPGNRETCTRHVLRLLKRVFFRARVRFTILLKINNSRMLELSIN